MGIDMNDVTGAIEIDGWGTNDDLVVILRPPKYGALKRLRAERERLNEAAYARMAELPEIPAAGETEGVDDPGTRARLARERVAAVAEINLDAAVSFWRFVMFGDDTFKGLAEPAPPDDVDEWPAALIMDARDITTEIGLVDRVFNHWGKVRSRSGPRA